MRNRAIASVSLIVLATAPLAAGTLAYYARTEIVEDTAFADPASPRSPTTGAPDIPGRTGDRSLRLRARSTSRAAEPGAVGTQVPSVTGSTVIAALLGPA